MPLRGSGHTPNVGNKDPYFDTLEELDAWAAVPANTLTDILPYHSRTDGSADSRGKLLVGGYTEIPSRLCYTFNFWSYCDIFVYFSHHRVTVPPSGWVTAAHRQGVKLLGTLIFEGSGEADCLRLVVGLPQCNTGPVVQSDSIPVSAHYARVLADLARQRGFDGYLLNFECPLKGGIEQARALAAWITLLRFELVSKVGSHSQVVWYDSVVINGQLRWQDRLNNYNLPFFLSSDAFFTNYTWAPQYPSLTAQYFLSLDQALKPKFLQDIFTGVDVWGRGSHGGGGFGSYRAISHIDPEFLGLSVALFGQAWTWESEQDKPNWTWEQWLQYETTLWVGPADSTEVVPVPDMPKRPGQPDCEHGPFQPISSYFPRAPPPDPANLAFYTSFCPGVGRAWFVNGVKVLQTQDGWADIDKQCSLGDLLWPRAMPAWEGDSRTDEVPTALPNLSMEDAWNGSSSLRLSISTPGTEADDAFFRLIWLPIQSLHITPSKSYEANIVYKLDAGAQVDIDLGLSVKLLSETGEETLEVNPAFTSQSDLQGGWARQIIQFTLSQDSSSTVTAVGLVIGFATEDPSQPCNFSVHLGQLAVYPSPPVDVSLGKPQILWSKFQRSSSPSLSGQLTWETATSFPPFTNIKLPSADDPNPTWVLADTKQDFSFLYFNIYAAVYPADGSTPDPAAAIFIGTTGLDGYANSFFVSLETLPAEVQAAKRVRFYVQGVNNRGEVLSWTRCAYVDILI
ncbi:glycoside hydrolase family 85 protein [Serpula lacrymans var. lacrymans S7.9]|uniref:Glycoside hydrolase family 85 protein n=1 Tax=Serpula lacrymans var. lacrymans (strain S7.9) TaxID=578457 RepID=F8NNM8_SERL9|nr:glycoside hydrolase family 85 protein [Serpula lacrymans var. lacrymans S7.9]EGO27070.1 glycoside hydrolase family 85 protein [Serpula lacrymans var. lacrymans S7.9]